MKKYEFLRVKETCYEETLPNGLKVRVIYRPDFARIHAVTVVNFGSVDTCFTFQGKKHRVPDGVAHYLEHKMFDLPEGEAMQMFAALGGNPNAFTTYENTAYYFDATENGEENLKLLLRMVFTPYFTEQSVQKEREIIAQEIRMYEDSADSAVYENLYAAMLRHNPVRVPIAGTVESIQSITAETLRLCYRAFYTPSNAVLCVKGNLAPEKVAQIARETTPSVLLPFGRPDYGAPEPLECAVHEVKKEMDVSMPSFAIGFRCQDICYGDATAEIAGDIAAELVMGESSDLYQRLYNAGVIDADFSVGFDSVRSLAMLTAGGDSQDPEAVRDAIFAEAERIKREGFSQEDFLRLKKSAIGRRIRDLDGFAGTCYRIGSYYFDGVEYLRFPESYDAVTEERVMAMLDCLAPERTAMSVILPRRANS